MITKCQGLIKELTQIKRNIHLLKTDWMKYQKNLNYYQRKVIVFLCRIYSTSNDGLQNMFVYQSTLDTLELRKGADNDYVISWKSKEIFNSKLV